jgi:glycosyltransferase involved in cell wall biosynthesis
MSGNPHQNPPTISVIVSCYNHEKYIEECILSIVRQPYKPLELIVVDDGSADNSPEILLRLRNAYNFILELHPHMGVAVSLNHAIRQYAHGKYLAFCGSDDFFAPNRFEQQVAYMEAHPEFAMVCGKVHTVDGNSRKMGNFHIIDPVTDPDRNLRFEGLVERNPVAAMTVLLRREVWDACGGYSEDADAEDLDLWLKITERHRIGFLDEYLAYYRWHGKNASADTLKMETAVWRILQNRLNGTDPAFARKILARRAAFAFNNLARHHKKEACRFFKLSLYHTDGFMLKNYVKGFVKLLLCRNTNGKSLWK